MDQHGFIHGKLDIKILILYVLRRLPAPVDPETLLETGHITEGEEGFSITEKGARNADAVESSLPYSVRAKAQKRIAPVEERMRRMAMITARHTLDEKGCMVELAVADGKGEMLHLHLLCAGEEQAKAMERRFRKDAEGYYQKIVELLGE